MDENVDSYRKLVVVVVVRLVLDVESSCCSSVGPSQIDDYKSPVDTDVVSIGRLVVCSFVAAMVVVAVAEIGVVVAVCRR